MKKIFTEKKIILNSKYICIFKAKMLLCSVKLLLLCHKKVISKKIQ